MVKVKFLYNLIKPNLWSFTFWNRINLTDSQVNPLKSQQTLNVRKRTWERCAPVLMLHRYFVRSGCTVFMYRQGKTSRRKFTTGMMGYMEYIPCFKRHVYVRGILYCLQCTEIVRCIVHGICTLCTVHRNLILEG